MYQANTRQFSQKTYSLFPLLLMTLVSLGLWSQEEDPELVLPEMILEVTTAGVEDVQALLPEEEDLPLPELALPLPEVEALDVRSIEMEGFTLEYRPGQEEFGAAGQSDLFLNARLGLGSPNALEAFFQVRKLGESPRFRLEFEHSGQDGYWLQGAYSPPGRNQNQGFDRFLGELIFSQETLDSQSLLEIQRKEYGLQSLGLFQSMDQQGIFGQTQNAFVLTEEWRWTLEAQGQVRNMVLSGDDSRFHQGADLAVLTGLTLSNQDLLLAFQLGGSLDYLDADEAAGWENRLTPYLEANQNLKLILPWSLELQQSASISWSGAEPLWAADLQLSRQSREFWSFDLRAGYEQKLLGIFDLWAEGEYLTPDGATEETPQRLLEGQGSLSFYFGQETEISLGALYRWEEDYPNITAIDGATGLWVWERQNAQRITPSLGLVLRPVPGLEWDNRLSYRYLSLEDGRAAHWDFTLEWVDSQGALGLTLEQEWSLFPSFAENFPQNGDPNLPVLDAGVYFTWNESFLTRLEVQDGLGAFLGQGRRGVLTEVLQPGFSIKATAEISY
jgi:hypothetical protein